MPIRCQCSSCGATYKVPDEAAGKRIKCAKCATVFAVVAVEVPASTPLVQKFPPAASASPLPRPKPAVPAPAAFPPTNPGEPTQVPEGFGPAINIQTRGGSTVGSTSPSVVGAGVPSSGVPSFGGINVGTSTVGGKTSVGSSLPGKKPAKSPLPLPWMIGGGGVLAVLVLLGAWFAFSSSSGGNGKQTTVAGGNSKNSGTLVIDWPEAERGGSKLIVDRKSQTVPSSGPVQLTLSPGSHHISILRRGFEPYNVDVQLSAGDQVSQRPEWKETAQVVVQTIPSSVTPPPGPTVTNDPGTKFNIGSAVVPVGFEGWEQSLINAKQLAQQSNKDILLLFGSSDGATSTARAADILRTAGLPGGELAQTIVPVVLDFPATSSGRDKVVDMHQNVELAKKFSVTGIGDMPTLIMLDSQGRPFAIQRELPKGGLSALPESVLALQNERVERDQLLSQTTQGTPVEQLKGAGGFVTWLTKREFLPYYSVEIATWYTQAAQVDPQNVEGVLELFPEAQLRCQLEAVTRGNVVELVRLLGRFDNWLKLKMQDPDRGVRIHLILGTILNQVGEEELGMAHYERAAIYTPKDSQLAEQVRGLTTLLQNRDLAGSGTGFVIAEGGYILTNRHVIEGDGKIQVRIPSVPEPVPAELIAIGQRDMALIKADFPDDFNPDPIPLVTGKLGRGLEVAAYGYPRGDALGRGLKFSKGAISDLPNLDLDNMILLDLRINPGNSGGPLCCSSGEVIGMITAKTGGDFDLDSYGMAIPAEELTEFLDQALPANAKRAPAADGATTTWDKISEKVTPGVLMILKYSE